MATPMPHAGRAPAERRFFLAMGLAMFAVVFVGFARSFFLRPLFPDWPSPSEPIFYVHGVAFAAWIVLLIAQASLVAGGRTDLHRVIGPFGAAWAGVMVILGAIAALVAARSATGFPNVPVPRLQFLAVPFFDLILFASFVALAVVGRRNASSHKRWMLLAVW